VIDELMERLPDHVIMVHDEVYYHFVEEEDFPYAIDDVVKGRNVIGLHSLSKAYGLAGMRLGYAFTTPELASYLHKLRRPFLINNLSMEGAIAALQDEAHIARTRELVAKEKQAFYATFTKLGIHYWPSHTNFILFRSPIPTQQLIDACLQHGVMIRSGETNGAMGCIRVSIGMPASNRAFFDALHTILAG
ncbi:MAG: aminotransferase class I/II-fold pyridoxal phosphate-dependent enzyme, partial [Bacteroidota bacterium]